MVVLVTGGSGFVGDNLIQRLSRTEKVINLDIAEPPAQYRNVRFVRCDITDYGKVYGIIKKEKPEYIYHTAAKVPLSKAGKGFADVNVGGTENIMKAALAVGVKRVVHTSSSAIYDIGNIDLPITEESRIVPVGTYGRAKWDAELVCQEYLKKGLDIVIIRPRTIVGTERAGIFQIMYKWISQDRNIPVIGDGNNIFQLISVDDLIDAMIKAAKKKGIKGEIFNIGNLEYGTLKGDLEKLIKHAGSKSRVKPFNASLARFGLRILDILDLSPLADWHYLTMDKPFYFDVTKAQKVLGWKPKDSNMDMYSRSYDWYMAHQKEVDAAKGKTHRTSPDQKLMGFVVKHLI